MAVIRGANLAWQLGGDAALLRWLAEHPDDTGAKPDVLVLVECRDRNDQPIDVAAALGPDWKVWQNLRDGSRAGTAIAVRRGSGVRRRRVRGLASRLLRLSLAGRDVQARYLRELHLRDADGPFTVAGAHIPLRSSGRQDDAIRALAAWWHRTRGRKVALGDGNTAHQRLERETGAEHSAGADVLFVLWDDRWEPMAVDVDDERAGTDHHILTLRPRRSTTR